MAEDGAGSNTIIESRKGQAFPQLSADEIDRLRRFGAVRHYGDGERLFAAGEPGPGMFVVLKGQVAVTRPDGLGHEVPVIDQGVGEFLAEIGQLSGRPAFVDGPALGEVETLLLPPEGLRAALVAEAELGEKIMRALVLRRVSLIEQGAGVLLIGRGDCPDTARLLGFLARDGQPHRHAEPGDAEVLDIVAAHPGAEDKPIAVCPDGRVLENPSETTLASCIGLTVPAAFAGRSFDVAIVGAGPAGLAAAVYAASEGLSVAVFDARAFGGQAGASTRIENYLGFPTGISGQALAGRAYTQALKFGAETSIPMAVGRLDCSRADAGRLRLELAEGGAVEARTVVLAVGARYRRLEVEGLERFEGRGVWYWASPIEARMAQGQEVLLVGGNSAGQAAVFLSSRVKRIRMLVRWPLRQTMSQYLIERIAASDLIEVVEGAEVTALVGGATGSRGCVGGPTRGRSRSRYGTCSCSSAPSPRRNGWRIAPSCCSEALLRRARRCRATSWANGRAGGCQLAPLETSVPGVFAIGDVRAGSVKRVGAAIGEGAAVVAQLHAHLVAQKG